MNNKQNTNKGDITRILKNGIRVNGTYHRARYSIGELKNYPKGTITVYAKSYADGLPSELNPKNESDSITDYHEKDKARITPGSKYYNDFLKHIK